uniref:C-factor-like n=1 Tax=Anas zonorhyncha TaxID=75864 RepID=A0A8B9V4N3_9AVES
MEGPGAQHVLVTGCDSGVGLGLVKRFLELPSPPRRLFAACTDPDGKVLVVSPWVSPCCPLSDVTDAGSIGAAVGRVRDELRGAGLGLLINTAGTRRHSTLQAETAENMALLYATNTIGPLQVTQAFLPLLQEAAQAGRGQGLSCSRAAVVNVSSAMGSIGVAAAWGDAQDVSYRCSKAALNMLTKCQALQYGHSGILCVAPFWVSTGGGSAPLSLSPQGPVTMEESTQGVLRVLAGLSASSNGTFWDWRGQSLPW